MRILFVAPRLPFPADTGAKIRTLNILQQLRKFAEVDLVCFSFEHDDAHHINAFRSLNINVHLVKPKKINILNQVYQILFNTTPYTCWKYFSTEMENTLRQLSHGNKYTIVHLDHIHMAVYQQCFPDLPCIVDEHNVEYKILERCGRVEGSAVKRAIYSQQAQKMKLFEQHWLKKMAAVFAVSENDRATISELTGHDKHAFSMFNGVDTDFFNTPGHQEQTDESIVFTGSMDWLPNEDAMLYFDKEILPLIRKLNRHVKLFIIGKSPTKALMDLARKDNRIVVTGRVNDVRPFIENAKVFIVPIRIGGGTRLKILEAMSMQKAVVSTTIGAEGISYTNGTDIVIADTPKDFAQKLLTLLNEPGQREALGTKARELVCKTYDWHIVGEKLKNVYTRVLHERTIKR